MLKIPHHQLLLGGGAVSPFFSIESPPNQWFYWGWLGLPIGQPLVPLRFEPFEKVNEPGVCASIAHTLSRGSCCCQSTYHGTKGLPLAPERVGDGEWIGQGLRTFSASSIGQVFVKLAAMALMSPLAIVLVGCHSICCFGFQSPAWTCCFGFQGPGSKALAQKGAGVGGNTPSGFEIRAGGGGRTPLWPPVQWPGPGD